MSFKLMASLPDERTKFNTGKGQVRQLQVGTDAENYQPLHGIFQFPDISRPAIIQHQLHGLRGKTLDRLFQLSVVFRQEMNNQGLDITFSLPQRRDMDGDNIQPVKQVFPKTAGSGWPGPNHGWWRR